MTFSVGLHRVTSIRVTHRPKGNDGHEWFQIHLEADDRDCEIVLYPRDADASTAIREALAMIKETEPA